MLKSHRLQIEAAELRSKINGMTETRENKAEYDELRAKLSKLDKEVAETLKTEGRDIDEEEREYHASGTGSAGSTPESRELRRMIDKAGDDFGPRFSTRLSTVDIHRALSQNFRQNVGCQATCFPWTYSVRTVLLRPD